MTEHFYKPLPVAESADRKRKTVVFLASLIIFGFAAIFVVSDIFAGRPLDSKENTTSAACRDGTLVETCRNQLKLKEEKVQELQRKLNETNVRKNEIERIVVEQMSNLNKLQEQLELCQQENRQLREKQDIEPLQARLNMVQKMLDQVLKRSRNGKGGGKINIKIDLSSGNVYNPIYRNSVVILSPLRHLLFVAAFFLIF